MVPVVLIVRTHRPQLAAARTAVRVVVAVIVFMLSRSFYPTTLAVPPMSFLIHHRQILWSQ